MGKWIKELELWAAINLKLVNDVDLRVEIKGETLPPRYRQLLSYTIAKLPEEVREKVLEGECFILIRNDKPRPRSVQSTLKEGKRGVYLDFGSADLIGDDKVMEMIAHRIAHCYLGYDTDESDSRHEREVDDLVDAWGFKHHA